MTTTWLVTTPGGSYVTEYPKTTLQDAARLLSRRCIAEGLTLTIKADGAPDISLTLTPQGQIAPAPMHPHQTRSAATPDTTELPQRSRDTSTIPDELSIQPSADLSRDPHQPAADDR
jgi:hypothetical protein